MSDDYKDRHILVQANQGTTGIAVWFDGASFYPVCGDCKDRIISEVFDWTCSTCLRKYPGLSYTRASYLEGVNYSEFDPKELAEVVAQWLGVPEESLVISVDFDAASV